MMLTPTKKLTRDDYYAMLAQPENADKQFEFIDSERVEKEMGSFTPSEIAALIGFFIRLYLREQPLGRLSAADGGFIMPNGDILIPDVGYIANERMPSRPDREVPVPPDLAVEVKSPPDRKAALRRKAQDYLAHGVKLVWLIFPENQSAEVYTADDELILLKIDDALSGGEVLPGLSIALTDIFPE
ncbi:MAG: Uma2 family endonuclease [Chloroflexota bacterium]|nr:Uma2 family endonuclease [Chloroflexota bacterium]